MAHESVDVSSLIRVNTTDSSPAISTVTEAHVVSTTFTDRQFVALAQEVVRRIDFGAASAAETRVVELPISFAPKIQ